MEYIPRYNQPFTLAQAVLLDVSVITEEISRLQNSINHLRATQTQLREHVATSSPADPEFTEAIEENEAVIGSQEERIGILELALSQKGMPTSSHYNPAPSMGTTAQGHDDEGGIHL